MRSSRQRIYADKVCQEAAYGIRQARSLVKFFQDEALNFTKADREGKTAVARASARGIVAAVRGAQSRPDCLGPLRLLEDYAAEVAATKAPPLSDVKLVTALHGLLGERRLVPADHRTETFLSYKDGELVNAHGQEGEAREYAARSRGVTLVRKTTTARYEVIQKPTAAVPRRPVVRSVLVHTEPDAERDLRERAATGARHTRVTGKVTVTIDREYDLEVPEEREEYHALLVLSGWPVRPQRKQGGSGRKSPREKGSRRGQRGRETPPER